MTFLFAACPRSESRARIESSQDLENVQLDQETCHSILSHERRAAIGGHELLPTFKCRPHDACRPDGSGRKVVENLVTDDREEIVQLGKPAMNVDVTLLRPLFTQGKSGYDDASR